MRLLRLGQRLEPFGDVVETLLAGLLREAGYIVSYSWVSPAVAAFRFFSVLPMGRPVAGSPTCFR